MTKFPAAKVPWAILKNQNNLQYNRSGHFNEYHQRYSRLYFLHQTNNCKSLLVLEQARVELSLFADGSTCFQSQAAGLIITGGIAIPLGNRQLVEPCSLLLVWAAGTGRRIPKQLEEDLQLYLSSWYGGHLKWRREVASVRKAVADDRRCFMCAVS